MVPMIEASTINVDSAFQLSDFTMRTNVMGMPLTVKGRRNGDRLTMNYGDLPIKGAPAEIEFPRDMTLADSFMPYAGGARLGVGKKWLVQTLEMSLKGPVPAKAFARVERKESTRWRGKDVQCYVVEIRKRENDELASHMLWVNDDGVVLVEQMSFDKLLYTIVLDEKRTITPDEARVWNGDWETRRK